MYYLDAEYQPYSDKGALIISRCMPSLRYLMASNCQLGWEGANALANSLAKLENITLRNNKDIQNGCRILGILPKIRILDVGTNELMI